MLLGFEISIALKFFDLEDKAIFIAAGPCANNDVRSLKKSMRGQIWNSTST